MVNAQEQEMQEAFDAVTGLNVSSGAGGGYGIWRALWVWIVWTVWIVVRVLW
jgi:hypothetical protein